MLRTRTFASDAIAWVVFLLLGGGGVLGWHAYTHHRVLAPRTWASSEDVRIAALAYDRVVTKADGRHVDAAKLRDQLLMLRQEGFEPVDLDAVWRFYHQGGGLPPRSLLLTFDHAYLSTAAAADPVLRELEWPAVMFVMTERQERRDPFFLYWNRMSSMVASGLWQIGSHGHRGHEPVAVDAAGGEGPAFLRRAWLSASGREETGGEFAERLREDHRRASAEIAGRVGREPLAYTPPLRDVAASSQEPETYRAYEETVRAFYDLAFVDDLFGVSDRSSDPHHLRRLRVRPSWTPADLADRLRAAAGRPAPEPPDALQRHVWVAGSGRAMPDGDGVLVTGAGRADLWRAGSPWTTDFVLEAEVRIGGGQFWIVQQSGDLSEEWRWGGGEKGTYLQRRRPGRHVETLARFPARVTPGVWHRLRVVRRGAGLWTEWDGHPIVDRPAYLPERWAGNVGCVAWDGGDATQLRLAGLRFEALPYRVRLLAGEPTLEEVQAAIRVAPETAGLSPLWLEASGRGLGERPLDRDLLAILARGYGWEIVPTLRVSPGSVESADAWLPDAFSRAAEQGWAGLRLDLTLLAPAAQQQISALARRGHREAPGWEARRLLIDTHATDPATLRAARNGVDS